MDLDKIINKGMRLTKPRMVNLMLRPEVYEWFLQMTREPHHCELSVLLQGVLEDFYDFYSSAAPEGGDR